MSAVVFMDPEENASHRTSSFSEADREPARHLGGESLKNETTCLGITSKNESYQVRSGLCGLRA